MKILETRSAMWGPIVFLCLVLALLVPSPLHAESLENAFWNRHWKVLEKQVQERTSSLTVRERVLWGNALWLQRRWKESMEVFKSARQGMPEGLRPYADMLFFLGLERTGRAGDARLYGERFFPGAPVELRYYAAFAMARLCPPEEKEKWFREMVGLATEDRQKITAYEGLLTLPGERAGDAVALLRLRSLHPGALELLRKVPREDRSSEVSFYLGYAAFLQGNFSKALDALAGVSAGSGLYERAAYYRGMAHYRKKEYQEAFSIWKGLVREGGERYASAAVKRLAILAGTSMKDVTLDLLEKTASTRDDRAGKRALFHLSKNLDNEKGGSFLERLARSYPLSDEAAELFWDKGWQVWKEGDPKAALVFWDRGLGEKRKSSRQAQLLYWSGRALEILERDNEAEARFRELLTLYPESYYSRLAFPGVTLLLVPGVPAGLTGETDPLETWGFVHYARLRYLSEGTPHALWRAAQLSSWMGDDRSAYRYASSVSDRLKETSGLSAPLMELLYPRPYRQRVSVLAKRFGVEELLIWSVMRQESGFDPQALSWVGASGLMQLMPTTALDEARNLGEDAKDLSNPDKNLLLGVSHMAGLLGRFHRLDWAIAAYNAGSGSVKRWTTGKGEVLPEEWVEDIPYRETRDYVKKVLGNLYMYRQIYRDQREVSN